MKDSIASASDELRAFLAAFNLDRFGAVIDDKVSASLRHVDLCPRDRSLSLDGIGYSLRVRTSSVSADLQFSNPRTESLRSVERALFAVAESVVRISERRDMADYLKIWQRYLS